MLRGRPPGFPSGIIESTNAHCASVKSVAYILIPVSGSEDNTLRVWDLETGETKATLLGHTNFVRALAVTLDGRHAVSGSADKTLRLWDLESGQTLRTLEGHTDWIQAVAVTPDGRHVVSGSADSTVRVWDLKNGKEITTFTGEYEMWSCAFAPSGETIIAGDRSGRMHFLRLVEADENKTKSAIGDAKIPLLQHKEQGTSATDS
jgi:WD40 repeat protein